MAKVWKFGDDIDTDIIIAARYLNTSDAAVLATHIMEDADKDFSSKIARGDIRCGGKFWGGRGPRGHAPMALKAAGISCVIAKNFARIFYRNSFNTGFLILECDETDKIAQGDELSIDLKGGVIKNLTQKTQYKFGAIPEFMQKLLDAGGAINYAKTKINL